MADRNSFLFRKAGELANQGQYSAAGQSILDGLNIVPEQAGTLDAKSKKLAYLAATYFSKSEKIALAIELYLALGEREKAADYLEKLGDIVAAQKVREGRLGRRESLQGRSAGAVGGEAVTKYTALRLEKEGRVELAIKAYMQIRAYADAGRLLRTQGRLEEAAKVYAEGGRAFEAAHCYFEIGDTGKALENYVRVPRDHKHYRYAALQVVSMAAHLGQMTFQYDNFLSEFIRTAPQDANEIEALYLLGGLYEAQDFLTHGQEVLQKVFDANPTYKDVAKRLERVQRISTSSAQGDAPPEFHPPSQGVAVGNIIADRYCILEEIGHGGMAVVYKAEDRELEEEIALKVFSTQISDPAAMAESEARFKQELQLSRKLTHKNIIRLYDAGIHFGHRYISMELLQGRDLEQLLAQKGGPYDFTQGIYLMIQACAGLHSAHEYGVVHRDIKPANLFVSNDGVLKVMDFGIAKNTVKPGMTVDGMPVGTPHYIAPEQISRFSKVTPSADLYALGVVMYQMFTHRVPFHNEDTTKLLMMHINNPVTPPRDLNPNIPKELQHVIMTLLKKNPSQRFIDARETAVHLKRVYKQITGA